LIILEPIFEADFTEASHGFRPNRSAHGAIREIYKYLNWGCEQIYDVDVEKYFDTVEHWKLMKLLAQRISDGRILHVIKQWLSCGYVEDGQHRQSKRGTPQGGVISPLLANIYLNPLDRAFERSRMGTMKAGSIHLVRYADDMLILAHRDLDKGIELLEHYLERLGLRLNQDKTRKLDLKVDKRVEFLGFEFHRVTNRVTKNRLILVAPSPGSQKRCRERVRKLINHNIPVRVKDQIENVNQFLMGWTTCFRLGNSGKALKTLNQYVNKRVRRVIQRRKGRNGYGWGRITSEDIYGRLGLFYNCTVQRL
jgi:group II intron reverse transcriptase/maturase